MRFRITYVLPIVLVAHSSLALDAIEDAWLSLISIDVSVHAERSCEARIELVVSQLVGNNGFRAERWRVKACEKLWTYDVEYYPREHFRDRDTDKVVRLVVE